MAHKEFLQKSFKAMNRRFIGFDMRILPLLGFVSLITPAIVWWSHRWVDALFFGALLLLCVFWYFSVYGEWMKLLPLEQAAKFQKDNPARFMSARFECLMVEKGKSWIGNDLIIASRLPYAVAIKKVDVILQITADRWKSKYDMHTRLGEQCGSVSGEAGQRDLTIRVHRDDDPELSKKLLEYVGEHPCNWIPLIEGTVIITTNELKEIPLNIPEASVIANILASDGVETI